MIRLKCFTLAALLLAITLPQLKTFGYSAFSFEMVLFATISVILGVAVGYFARNRFVFGGIMGFLLYLLLDAYFLDVRFASSALVVTVFGLPLLLKYAANGIPLAVLVFSAGFTISNFLTPSDPVVIEQDMRAAMAAPAEKPRVAYIHLILDEQMSPLVAPERMPLDFTPDHFFDLYLSNGFTVYGLADANSRSTFESVSSIFGITNAQENYIAFGPYATFSFAVDDNRLMQELDEQGFSTTVIQSTFLQLCGDQYPVNCRTYSRGSNMRVIEGLGASWARRVQLALMRLHDEYLVGANRLYVYRLLFDTFHEHAGRPFTLDYGEFTRPIISAQFLRDIAAQAADIEPGEAIVAHLLVPHFPYVLDQECALRAPSDWGNPVRQDHFEDPTRAYATFWDQAICTGDLIADVIDQVADRDDVVLIIHGDHGGRIVFGTAQENDADTLSTFLAIKSPAHDRFLFSEPVSLQDVFSREFRATIGVQTDN